MKKLWPSLLVVPFLLSVSCADRQDGENRRSGGASTVKLHVRDFGAVPSSANIFQALEDVVAAAKAVDGPVEIFFEPEAIYRVTLPNAAELKDTHTFQKQYAWHIKNATNLVVNGRGSTLLVTDPEIGGICMEGSSHIGLKNFKIDYDPLPYTQGTITKVNLSEYWFELKLDEGFPEPNLANFKRAKKTDGNWGLTIRDEPNGHRRYGPTAVFAADWEKTGERLWRFHPSKKGSSYSLQNNPLQAANLKTGERYVHMARNWAQALAGRSSDHVLWENITILSSPGLAFYPRGTSHHTIRDCHVKLKKGRIFSTDADGIHMRGSRGHALIEGCSFEGMADDGINVHSSALSVIEIPSPNQVVVRKHTFSVRPGDELLLVRSESATVLGKAKVATVEDQGGSWRITCEQDLPKLAAGKGFASSDNLYNLSEAANPFVIRNCHFKDYRGRGILVSAYGGTVENNLFEMPEGWGVVLLYESTRWGEGPIAYDLTIRNNEFRAHSNPRNPAIITHLATRAGASVESRPFHDIRIEGNTFHEYGMPTIVMQAARDVVIAENRIFCSAETERRKSDYATVVLKNCENILIDKLGVDDPDQGQYAVVEIGADCAPGKSIAVGNQKTSVVEPCLPVLDRRIE